MNELPSGSFLPAGLLSLEPESAGMMAGFNHAYGNFGLKAGIVIAVHEKDDEKNITKAMPEYDVAVFEQNADGAQNTIVYKNCVCADLFGAVADFLEFRYREQKKVEKKDNERVAKEQDGSMVMIMCLNGVADKAVIVGGMPHPKRESKLTKELGHTLLGEFNGITLAIDKDGALKIGFKRATDHTGKAVDEKPGGSYMKIEKDGSLEMSSAKGETLRLDKTKQTAELKSTKDLSIMTGAKFSLTATDAANMEMKDWMVKASGSATLTVKGLDLKSEAAVNMQGSAFEIKSDGVFKVQGSTIVLDGMTYCGGQGGGPALTLTTQFMGVGNLGAPVLSTAIGPFSSKVFIAP
jgi:hypothetical protein